MLLRYSITILKIFLFRLQENSLFVEHAKYKHSPWKCAGCNFKSKDFPLLYEHSGSCDRYKRRHVAVRKRQLKSELNSMIECFACGRRLQGGFPALLVHFMICDEALAKDEKRVGITKSIAAHNINEYAANSNIELNCHNCKKTITDLAMYTSHQEECNVKTKKKSSNNRRVFPNASDRNTSSDLGQSSRHNHESVDTVLCSNNEETESVQIVRPVIRKRKYISSTSKNKVADVNDSTESLFEPMIKQCRVNVEKLNVNGHASENHHYAPKAFKVFTTQIPKELAIKDSNKDLMIQKIFSFPLNDKASNSTTVIQQEDSLCSSSAVVDEIDPTNVEISTQPNDNLSCVTQPDSNEQSDILNGYTDQSTAISPSQRCSSFIDKQKQHIIALSKNQVFLDHDTKFLKSVLTTEPFVRLKDSKMLQDMSLQSNSVSHTNEPISICKRDGIQQKSSPDTLIHRISSDNDSNAIEKCSEQNGSCIATEQSISFLEKQKQHLKTISENKLFLDYDTDYLKSFLTYKPIVKLKKLELKSSPVNVTIPHLNRTATEYQDNNENTIEHDVENEDPCNANEKLLMKESVPDKSKHLERHKIPKEKSGEKTKDDWGSISESIRLPVIRIKPLDLNSPSVIVMKGSIPNESYKIDSLPLPPTFDHAYLEEEHGSEIRWPSDTDVMKSNFDHDSHQDDNYLVGVTDTNAWVHKDIESPAIHTQLPSQNDSVSREGTENNVYEILDSRTITIECMNESSDDDEEYDIEWKQKDISSKRMNGLRQMTLFNPILNLDGLKL